MRVASGFYSLNEVKIDIIGFFTIYFSILIIFLENKQFLLPIFCATMYGIFFYYVRYIKKQQP